MNGPELVIRQIVLVTTRATPEISLGSRLANETSVSKPYFIVAPLLFRAATRYHFLLVPGHKYPKMKGDHLYGGTDMHGCFAIYSLIPVFGYLWPGTSNQRLYFW